MSASPLDFGSQLEEEVMTQAGGWRLELGGVLPPFFLFFFRSEWRTGPKHSGECERSLC